jgi:hypothetical protein
MLRLLPRAPNRHPAPPRMRDPRHTTPALPRLNPAKSPVGPLTLLIRYASVPTTPTKYHRDSRDFGCTHTTVHSNDFDVPNGFRVLRSCTQWRTRSNHQDARAPWQNQRVAAKHPSHQRQAE